MKSPDATADTASNAGASPGPDSAFTDDVAGHWTRVRGYCNTATVGIPPRAAAAALHACVDDWLASTLDTVGFDDDVHRARTAWAALVGTHTDRVAMPGALSITAGLVASSLPDGATVLCAEEDFTSVLFPFLVDRRLDVRLVPLEHVLEEVRGDVDLVAVSAVQSADGRVLDLDDLATAAADHDVRTFVDVSQAAGWLPIGADRFDVVGGGAYKWLCSPRGVGFLAVREDVDWLVPRLAGWYAGGDPWASIYGGPLRLADDARQFTVSPAWLDMPATAIACEALGAVGVERIHAHDVGLANRFRDRLGLGPSNSAIVSVTTRTDPADDLEAAGVTTASRGGRTRVSFHLTNAAADADLVADVLAPHMDA